MGLQGAGGIIFFIKLLVANLFLSSLINYGAEGVRSNYGAEGVRSISKDEDIELERQLKLLNKPPIKTFHTEWGDIVDCIDIYKQPAFDHPLLKDHKIQTSPSFPQKSKAEETLHGNETEWYKIMSQAIECPEGTVPIRRTRKEDLIRAKNHSMSKNSFKNQAGALLNLVDPSQSFYGASARINLYNPTVAADQFSAAQMWVMKGQQETVHHNAIQSGWIVFPQLYGDHLTRLFGYWTGDGYQSTGCWNTACPGFVQVDNSSYLGSPLYPISTYGGSQYSVTLYIYQDSTTGNWWLKVNGRGIGYWPKSLFTTLANDGADFLSWGGHVTAGADEIYPPMGSGHIPDSCFFRNVQFVTESFALVDIRNDMPVVTLLDCPYYSLTPYGYRDPKHGYTFLFGGPGGRCP